MRRLIGLAFGLLTAGCSIVGVRSGTEEPRFDLVERSGAVEIRRYAPRVAIETIVQADEAEARSDGFRRLADYIFGNNQARSTIAMTAPVTQETARPSSQTIAMTAPVAQDRDENGAWRIRFFAPASYTLDAMPIPNNPLVSVVTVPSETLAVLQFSGDRSPEAVADRRRSLLAQLAGSPWRSTGVPFAWFYDPPWTIPAFRRNEVAVPVAPR